MSRPTDKRELKLWERVRRLRRLVIVLRTRSVKSKLKGAEAELAKYRQSRKGASRVSPRGIQLVKDFEGFFPRVYDDGLGFATIGYGFRWPEEYAGRTITEPQAAKLLREKLNGGYGNAVRKASKLANWPLTQNQFDSLVSFTFNIGVGWVGATGNQTGATLWSAFKRKDPRSVADALLLYVNPGSPVEAGLRRRRQAERKLWLTP